MGLFKSKKQVEVKKEGIKTYELKSNGKYKIELENNFISITPSGMMNMMNKGIIGTKKICLDNVSGVQYKSPGLTTGYIQFVLIGSQENKGGVMGAVKDENTILFNKKEENIVLEIKDYVENYIFDKSTNKAKSNNISAADEILKFKSLLDLGAITEEEYEEKKKSLLAE